MELVHIFSGIRPMGRDISQSPSQIRRKLNNNKILNCTYEGKECSWFLFTVSDFSKGKIRDKNN